jgi:hypothetical protein
MRRLWFAILSALVVGALTAAVALAGNAHFIKSATGATLQGNDLLVTFKEAGLESGSVETITVDALATTTYQCRNNGGKNPSASNKTTTVRRVSESGEFPAAKNGNVVGSLTLSPPSAAALGFACPPGQTVEFVSVTYADLSVTDEDTGATLAIAGTFTYTNPNAAP